MCFGAILDWIRMLLPRSCTIEDSVAASSAAQLASKAEEVDDMHNQDRIGHGHYPPSTRDVGGRWESRGIKTSSW
jgi:hypothetical protein